MQRTGATASEDQDLIVEEGRKWGGKDSIAGLDIGALSVEGQG